MPASRSRVLCEEIDAGLELTAHEDPAVRSKALRSLCPCHVKAQDDRIWQRIFELAADESKRVRATVFHALGDGSPRALEQDVIATLETMRNDADLGLRRQVRKLLAHYRRTGKVNVL
jgi:HEAT repeat protein